VKRFQAWGLVLLCAAPACYTGSAKDVSPQWIEQARGDHSWQMVSDVPFVAQKSDADCGPAALAMVLGHFGVAATLDQLTALDPPSEGGVRAGALRDVARAKGLEAFIVSGTFNDLVAQIDRGRPILVGLAKPMVGRRAIAHYEVVIGINRSKQLILSLDPSRGPRQNTLQGFAREWVPTHQVTIVIFSDTQRTSQLHRLPMAPAEYHHRADGHRPIPRPMVVAMAAPVTPSRGAWAPSFDTQKMSATAKTDSIIISRTIGMASRKTARDSGMTVRSRRELPSASRTSGQNRSLAGAESTTA
jgi:predicted double-glycine peptidase